MGETEERIRRERLKRAIKIVPLARRLIMGGLDEMDDFSDFMKSAIRREQELTSKRLEEGASGLEGG